MSEAEKLRLGVNIDHVATLRNARGGSLPDPVHAAAIAAQSGADGITAHLREDRRHIRDADIERLAREIDLPLNLEMAATEEMRDIALQHQPNACCLVPESREEVTTEGGLNVLGEAGNIGKIIAPLKAQGIRISLFIDPDPEQIGASAALGADIVELHTGTYCHAHADGDEQGAQDEIERLQSAAILATQAGIEVHAGHGLCFETVGAVAAMPQIVELNIGHFLIGASVFSGLPEAIAEMRRCMQVGRAAMDGRS